MIEVKDEILSGEARYNIKDNGGNIIQSNVDIELATPVVQEGTPINKALFEELQGDLYTMSKYNIPSYSGIAMSLDLPLASYETGKIINIQSPANFDIYPTINVNNLGAKTIRSTLVANEYYSLRYNGVNFDVLTQGENQRYYTPAFDNIDTLILKAPVNLAKGTIINIKSPITITSPKLTINGSDAKTINVALEANGLYTLVYNGVAFDSNAASVNEAKVGSNKSKFMTPYTTLQAIKSNISFKTGTISDGGTIPQTEGYDNYLYFVSPNSAINNENQSDSYPYGDTYIECSVVQTTRKVTCEAGAYSAGGYGGSWSTTGGTANYLEIAWN